MSTQNTSGFAQLLQLQDNAEEAISNSPDRSETMQSLLWDIYRKGEAVGMIRKQLEIAHKMREAGYTRMLISRLTQLPEADLTLWEEVHSKQPN